MNHNKNYNRRSENCRYRADAEFRGGKQRSCQEIAQQPKTAPPRKQPGIIKIGFAVRNRLFTKCGTAIPTKETGPANAVTQAESTLDKTTSMERNT